MKENFSSRALKALAVVDRLYESGVVSNYALSGGFAALFYTEAVSTRDIDFIFPIGVGLDRASELYAVLERKGYSEINSEGYLLIEGWPVHFNPPLSALQLDLLATARRRKVEGFEVTVARPEHLAADSVAMSRAEKDYARLIRLQRYPYFNEELFEDLLLRFNLKEKWETILPKLT